MQTLTPFLLALSICAAQPPVHATPPTTITIGDFAKLSPFTEVRVNSNDYEVRFEGSWYRLIELNGFSAKMIREHCDSAFGSRSEKRFAEDLVEVLAGLGQVRATHADLVLINLGTQERSLHKSILMTNENRQAVWSARKKLRPSSAPAATGSSSGNASRVSRAHALEPASVYKYLAEPLTCDQWASVAIITRSAAEADLDQLEYEIENTYSYRDLKRVDFKAALDAVRLGLAQQTSVPAFTTRIAQVLALFGDGHTRVRGLSSARAAGSMTMLVADSASGPVAFPQNRSSFIAPQHPYLVAIDGEPLDVWIERSAKNVAAGSPQFVRRQALRGLRSLNALRVEAGLETKNTHSVTFANAAGETVTGNGTLLEENPIFAEWPRAIDPSADAEYRVMESDIGYLRIFSMRDDRHFLQTLTEAMQSFEHTRGMVIDVRGNGGGTRDATRLLLPYFLDPASGSHVVNIAAARINDPAAKHQELLVNRALYPSGSTHWTEQERKAITEAASNFTPDWMPAQDQFSDWNYCVVSPGETFYDKPLIILMNTGCYSATDIFLGAFAGLPNVTLMGTASGGGSGRSRSKTLANSGLRYKLSSMASFRPGGQRYDGKGIAPDVIAEPLASDYLVSGEDSVLTRALGRLR